MEENTTKCRMVSYEKTKTVPGVRLRAWINSLRKGAQLWRRKDRPLWEPVTSALNWQES